MLEVHESDQGVIFNVKVTPRASREQMRGVESGALKVRLTAPPVDDKANKALIKLLAKRLGVAKSKVQIKAGHKSRAKRVMVAGLTAAQVTRRLDL